MSATTTVARTASGCDEPDDAFMPNAREVMWQDYRRGPQPVNRVGRPNAVLEKAAAVVAAKAETHNHRLESLREPVVTAFFAQPPPGVMGPGSARAIAARRYRSLVRDDMVIWVESYRPIFFRHAAKSVSVCSSVAG